MDIKINQITGANQVYDSTKVPETSEEFKFMLMSKISEEDLQAQKKKDIRRNVFSHEDMIQ